MTVPIRWLGHRAPRQFRLTLLGHFCGTARNSHDGPRNQPRNAPRVLAGQKLRNDDVEPIESFVRSVIQVRPPGRVARPLLGHARHPEVMAGRTTWRYLHCRRTAARTAMFTPVQDATASQGEADSRAHQGTEGTSRGEAEHGSGQQPSQRGTEEVPANPLVHQNHRLSQRSLPSPPATNRRFVTPGE